MTDINVGAITEALNDKTDRDLQNVDNTAGADAVIEYQLPTAENNYTWYRKYKSGWVEQGGIVTTNTNPRTINLPVTMADTNYQVFGNVQNGTDNVATFTMQPRTLTTTSVSVYCTYSASHGSGGSGESYYWRVEGIAAQ